MTNIVNEIFSFGRPIGYWPLDSHDFSLSAIGGLSVSLTGGAGLSAAVDPWADRSVMGLDGVSQDVTIPNFETIVNGHGGLTVLLYCYLNALQSTQYFLFNSLGGSSIGFEWFVQSNGTVGAPSDIALGVDGASLSDSLSWEAGVWVPMVATYAPATLGAALGLGYPTAGDTKVALTSGWSSDVYAWPAANALRLGGLGARMAGRLGHLVVWDKVLPVLDVLTALGNTTAGGRWCTVNLAAAGRFKIDATDQASVTSWDYWLYDNADEQILFSQGLDFSLDAVGDAVTPMYVPTAGNYFLVLRDPVSGKSHAQTVPLVAV